MDEGCLSLASPSLLARGKIVRKAVVTVASAGGRGVWPYAPRVRRTPDHVHLSGVFRRGMDAAVKTFHRRPRTCRGVLPRSLRSLPPLRPFVHRRWWLCTAVIAGVEPPVMNEIGKSSRYPRREHVAECPWSGHGKGAAEERRLGHAPFLVASATIPEEHT